MVKGRRDVLKKSQKQPARQNQEQQFGHDTSFPIQDSQQQQSNKGGGVGSTRVRDALQWNPLAPEEITSEEKVAEEKQNHGNVFQSPLEIKKKIQEERVATMIEKSEKNLFSCKTFFPFDLFPDEIYLDELKLIIRQHEFFYSEHTKTVLLSDIQNVTVSYAGFLAKLVIRQRNEDAPVVIDNMKKKDAIKAQRIIQGLIVAKSENIPLAMLSEQEVLEKLEKLGQ